MKTIEEVNQIEKQCIISEINSLLSLSLDNKTLEWSLLCQNTDFDSTATALYFGIGWEKDMLEAHIGHLKMALFNIASFPYGSRNKYNIERKKKKELHLCDTCILEFATCISSPKFGSGPTNDNVYECPNYKEVEL